jgi:lysine 2,3-aminomutase
MVRIREFTTPHFESLIQKEGDPLHRQVVANPEEDIENPDLTWDPLLEKKHSPVPGLIHRYPHIALLLVTPKCFSYCRFCFRAHYLNSPKEPSVLEKWGPIETYLRSHPEIQEVLLSGGDPLMLNDTQFQELGSRIREISKDIIIRIGTRAPVFQPKRYSEKLMSILESLKPVVMSIHVNHEREITSEFEGVVRKLMHVGISCYAQTVLLKSVNDDSDLLRALFKKLYRVNVRPYYLHLCDRVHGTKHFMVSPAKATQLWRSLWGSIPGMAMPHLVFDDATRLGKVPLQDHPTLQVDAQGRAVITSVHDKNLQTDYVCE